MLLSSSSILFFDIRWIFGFFFSSNVRRKYRIINVSNIHTWCFLFGIISRKLNSKWKSICTSSHLMSFVVYVEEVFLGKQNMKKLWKTAWEWRKRWWINRIRKANRLCLSRSTLTTNDFRIEKKKQKCNMQCKSRRIRIWSENWKVDHRREKKTTEESTSQETQKWTVKTMRDEDEKKRKKNYSA